MAGRGWPVGARRQWPPRESRHPRIWRQRDGAPLRGVFVVWNEWGNKRRFLRRRRCGRRRRREGPRGGREAPVVARASRRRRGRRGYRRGWAHRRRHRPGRRLGGRRAVDPRGHRSARGTPPDAMVFEPGLREQWADEARRWLLRAASYSLAATSARVLAALRVPLDLESGEALLAALCSSAAAAEGGTVAHGLVSDRRGTDLYRPTRRGPGARQRRVRAVRVRGG